MPTLPLGTLEGLLDVARSAEGDVHQRLSAFLLFNMLFFVQPDNIVVVSIPLKSLIGSKLLLKVRRVLPNHSYKFIVQYYQSRQRRKPKTLLVIQWRFYSDLVSWIIMRFDIQLQVKALRCMRGLFATLLKVLFSSKEKASIFLIYFLEPKQIRLLIDSENCQTILAVDPRISISDKSSSKEGSELLVIEFKDGESLLRSLCDLVDKQGAGDVNLVLSKDKQKGNEEPFRSLNLVYENLKFRSEVFKPLYDPQQIINHEWLNGCASPEWRKVQFDMDTEHLLNILRVLVRSKETSNKEKLARIIFQFSTGKVFGQLEKYKHNSSGQIGYYNFRSQKYEGDYSYTVRTEDAGKVYQLLLGKSSGSKIFIDTKNRLVFSYFQQGVFESQALIKEWMCFQSFTALHPRVVQTKLEL